MTPTPPAESRDIVELLEALRAGALRAASLTRPKDKDWKEFYSILDRACADAAQAIAALRERVEGLQRQLEKTEQATDRGFANETDLAASLLAATARADRMAEALSRAASDLEDAANKLRPYNTVRAIEAEQAATEAYNVHKANASDTPTPTTTNTAGGGSNG